MKKTVNPCVILLLLEFGTVCICFLRRSNRPRGVTVTRQLFVATGPSRSKAAGNRCLGLELPAILELGPLGHGM